MAETGPATFGGQQYGVLTKSDSTRLMRLAIKGAQASPEEGYSLRQLILKLLPIIGDTDCLLLAEECESACHHKKEWSSLAERLRAKAEQGGLLG